MTKPILKLKHLQLTCLGIGRSSGEKETITLAAISADLKPEEVVIHSK